eukprot:363888-Chlamydomonas_euryale.AAC.15
MSRPAGQPQWPCQLGGPNGHISWAGPMRMSAGLAQWPHQLGSPNGHVSWAGPTATSAELAQCACQLGGPNAEHIVLAACGWWGGCASDMGTMP